MSIGSRIKITVKTVVGMKDYYTKDDYTLCSIALFGSEPTNAEIRFLLGGDDNVALLTRDELFLALRQKDITYRDRGARCLDLEQFRLIDRDSKGYITIEDVFDAYTSCKCMLPWNVVAGCFRDIALCGNVDYGTFKRLYAFYNNYN